MPPFSFAPHSGVPARHAAWRILLEQETGGAFLKDLFATARGVPERDAALVRALCFGVMRWRLLLDDNLDACAPRGIRGARLRMLLRVAAYQLFFLSGIPDFAAVDTAVEIAKREFGRAQAGFANALLKAVARQGLRRRPGNDAASLSVNFSHPRWLVERWSRDLAPAALAVALQRNNEEAPLWIRINPRRATPPAVADALAEQGVPSDAWPASPWFRRLTGGGEAALRSPLFAQGAFAFQDPVAHWVAQLLDWHPGQTLYDACSAPGGKAALLLETAAARGEDAGAGRIVCGDASWNRLRRIGDARRRLGHTELLPVCADLGAPPFRSAFDRVLLDAPCSNLGVLRRRPEARWSASPEKITALARRQKALLERAATCLAAGGRLVYAVCSAEGEETVEVVQAFVAAHPEFALEPAEDKVPTALCKHGCLWVYPGETESDGFFAAALTRRN